MLKIEHNHHMNFPHFELRHPRMELAPVAADTDEIAQAIENDPIDHDNNWQLVERPDPGKLEAFWDQVVADVKQDPDWVNFSQD